MGRKKDLTGKKFGSLTVVTEAGRSKSGEVLWLCKCDCGKGHIVRGGLLASGKIQSCGRCSLNSYRLSEDGVYYLGKFTNRGEFLIDTADYENVRMYNWYQTMGYAEAHINGRQTKLHRFLMNAPSDIDIDHVNGIRADNRRSNLRFATRKQNNRNVGLRKTNRTGVKGCIISPNRINIGHKYL